MRIPLLISATVLIFTSNVWSRPEVPGKVSALVKVYIGPDGLTHIVDEKGNDLAMPKEKGQVEVSKPKVSADKHTAGWLIHEENCCTSYTIPTRLVLYRDGKRRTLGDGLMIYDWCFVSEGTEVALSTGTVHGMQSRHLTLYHVASTKLLSEWNGALDATPPAWAKDLEQ